MGRLTTHVLDTASGRPASGIGVTLFQVGPERRKLLEARTNRDGRCDQPLLDGETMRAGIYDLVFRVGAYFAGKGDVAPEPRFLDEVVIRFGIAEPTEHYHVPLLISPYGYSTYRGS